MADLHKFSSLTSFFEHFLESKDIGIYRLRNQLQSSEVVIQRNDLKRKCTRLPYKNDYIVMTLLNDFWTNCQWIEDFKKHPWSKLQNCPLGNWTTFWSRKNFNWSLNLITRSIFYTWLTKFGVPCPPPSPPKLSLPPPKMKSRRKKKFVPPSH